jgi:hypothetical protein
MNASGLMQPVYHGDFFRSCQERLDAAVERGITREKLEAFFIGLYTDQAKTINTADIQQVSMATLESGILKPRQDLYVFILYNWIRFLFLPSIDEAVRERLLIFGVGRIFSAYSNIGVQYCTDADLNFVLDDSVPAAAEKRLIRAVAELKQTIWDLFTIIVEVNSSFTVLRIRDIRARLAHRNRKTRLGASLFYKGNSGSLFIIHNNSDIHTAILDEVSPLPDHLIFENFLGSNPAKPGYLRLKNDEVPLSIISDATLESEPAGSLIGSRSFLQACRQRAGIHPDLFPQQWIFSMKYSINRAYDYVSAMVHAGYSLREIGFTGSRDPDYVFLGQAHRLMLFLQELIHIKLDSYTNLCDYSYISADRFAGFMDPPKGFFRRDFDAMVLSPHFLLASQRQRYSFYAKSIHDKKEIILSITNTQMEPLVANFGLRFRHLDNGSGKNPVAVPYTWEGLGFFVFSALESRLSSIVNRKLAPAIRGTERSHGQ